MTPTEEKALVWLQANGFHEIEFHPHEPIDFTTSTGSFEVKKPTGKSIIFNDGQLAAIKEAEATILIFDETANPDPRAIVGKPYDDFRPFKPYSVNNRLTLTITNPETASQIEALSKELGVSYPDIVTLAIRGKLPK